MAFFVGVFGSFLTFAESWNIQFQIEVFHLNHLVAPLVNSAVILGVAVGSIASGAIADRWGYPKPAQVGAVLRFINLVLLASTVLPEWIAVICQTLLGIGMGTAALGLACLRASVRENGFPMASSRQPLDGVPLIRAVPSMFRQLSTCPGLADCLCLHGLCRQVQYACNAGIIQLIVNCRPHTIAPF